MIVELKLPNTPILKDISLEQLSLTKKEWDALIPDKKQTALQNYVNENVDQFKLEVTNWSEVNFE